MVLFEKFGQHQPLNRQSERYAREGIDLSLSTLADQVGACAAALAPLHALIEAPCPGRRAAAWRRHHGSDPRQGQDRHGPDLGLCPRRPALRRHRTRRRRCSTPRATAGESIPSGISPLERHSAGRRLRRLQRALSARAQAGADRRGAVLEPCAAQVLRTRRHRRQCAARARTRRRSRRSRWRPSNAST